MRIRFFNTLNTATTALSIYLGMIFLAYCLIFLWACPSVALGSAVLVEIGLFCLSLFLLKKNLFAFPAGISRYLTRFLNSPGWSAIFKVCRQIRLCILALVAIFASYDFVAFSTAAFCNSPITAQLYCLIPTSQLLGLHPAATLESLAGAFVEHGDFAKAEPLYQAILTVRKHETGPNSDLVAGLYVDLGDLNIRKHDLHSAEKWYRQATVLAPKSGRALTGLATTLREVGCLEESKSYYLRALACRSRIFGVKSRQYQDTLRGYKKLIALQASGSKS